MNVFNQINIPVERQKIFFRQTLSFNPNESLLRNIAWECILVQGRKKIQNREIG